MEELDWQRIAEAVIARRVELGMKTTKALAERSFLTSRLLGDVENARRQRYAPATLRAIELGLRWLPGSIRQVGMGGEPTPADSNGDNRKVHRPGQGWRFVEGLGRVDDDELRRRWLRVEIERTAIEIEFAERHEIPVEVAANLLRERRSPGDSRTTLSEEAELLRKAQSEHIAIPIDPAAGTGIFIAHAALVDDDVLVGVDDDVLDAAARRGDLEGETGYLVRIVGEESQDPEDGQPST